MGQRRSLSKKLRYSILARDGFKCRYCGRGSNDVVLVIDHVVPVCAGGSNHPTNLVTSCFDCNAGKGGNSPSDLAGAVVAIPAAPAMQLRPWVIGQLLEITGRAQCDTRTVERLVRYGTEYGHDTLAQWFTIATRRLGLPCDDVRLGRYISGIRRRVREIEQEQDDDYADQYEERRAAMDAEDAEREAALRNRSRTPTQERDDYALQPIGVRMSA